MFVRAVLMLLCTLNLATGVWVTPVFAAPHPDAGRWQFAEFPSGARFQLELAISDEDRARGYMYREKVGEQEGMLFVFQEPGHHGFWMRNCKIALDLIWLDEQRRVVHIERDAPPCPPDGDCPLMRPFIASHYVLEVAAGLSQKHNLHIGDAVVLVTGAKP